MWFITKWGNYVNLCCWMCKRNSQISLVCIISAQSHTGSIYYINSSFLINSRQLGKVRSTWMIYLFRTFRIFYSHKDSVWSRSECCVYQPIIIIIITIILCRLQDEMSMGWDTELQSAATDCASTMYGAQCVHECEWVNEQQKHCKALWIKI